MLLQTQYVEYNQRLELYSNIIMDCRKKNTKN